MNTENELNLIENIQDDKVLQKSNYDKGFEDGKVSASEKSYENGFRDGVKNGVEVGYYIGYIEFIKKFVENNYEEDDKENQDKMISKIKYRIKSLLCKEIKDNTELDEIKKLYKLITSSLKTLSKRK